MLAGVRNLALATTVAALLTIAGGCCSFPLVGGGCTVTDQVVLRATMSLNDCDGTGSHPVTLRLYSLAEAAGFAEARFDDLWLRADAKLGPNLVDVREQTLKPGEEITVTLPRGAKVLTLGVVANFCDGVPGCWKQVVPLTQDAARVTVNLDRTCLSLE